MDVAQLIRSREKIRENLVDTDEVTVTKTGCKLYIPLRYVEVQLAKFAEQIHCVGYIGVVVDNMYYGMINVPTILTLGAADMSRCKIGNQDYYELVYRKGSVVIANMMPVQIDTLPYYVFNEFSAGAKFPWFMDEESRGKLFDLSKKYAGSSVGEASAVMELIASITARDPTNKTQYYRLAQVNPTIRPVVIRLNDVTYGATSPFQRLTGNRMDDGIRGSLLYPTDKVETLEDVFTR